MIGQAVQLLQLAIAAFLLAAVTVASARRPVVIVYALLVVHFWALLAALPSLRVMGIGASPVDAVNLVAFGAAAIRMRRPRGLQWPLIGVAALVLVAVARAILTFDTGNALLGFRAELYFIVPALFAATLKPRDVSRALTAFWRFGLAMAGVAAGRWLLLAVGVDVGSAPNPEGYEVARVINAQATLTVAVAAVLGTWHWLHGKATRRYHPVVILGMLSVVLFAQHRSVWVAAAAMLLIVFVGSTRRLWLRIGVALALATVIVLVELFGLGDSGPVGDSLAYAASNAGTWEWRLQRWHDVWSTHAGRGVAAVVFGSGYGYSWVSGAVGVWEVSPHNGYLQIAVRIGLLGAALLFGTYVAVIARLGRKATSSGRVIRVLTLGILVFFIPYSGSMYSGLLLGAAVALVMARHEPVTPTPT